MAGKELYALRERIEDANAIADPARRRRVLEDVRDVVEVSGLEARWRTYLAGRIETYQSDADKQIDAGLLASQARVEEARRRADVRDEMLVEHVATASEMDVLDYRSHGELDELAAAGQLEERLALDEVDINFERLHPRRRGRWIRKLGAVNPYYPDPPKQQPVKRAAPAPMAYEEQAGALDERVAHEVREGVRGLDAANVKLNDAGKISFEVLQRFEQQATTQPTSTERYAVEKDGRLTFNKSRKPLHDHIKATVLDDHKSQKKPRVLMIGGGPASGKGTVQKQHADWDPDDSVYIDDDTVKFALLEDEAKRRGLKGGAKELLNSDPEASLLVGREANFINNTITQEARKRKMNMIVDALNDTSKDDQIARVKAFRKAGYQVDLKYVTIPADEGVNRGRIRAQKATEAKDRRTVPEVLQRAIFRDMASTVPALADGLGGLGASLEVYDNNQGKDEAGNFKPAKRIFDLAPGSDPEVDDEALWERFKASASDDIGIEEAAEDEGVPGALNVPGELDPDPQEPLYGDEGEAWEPPEGWESDVDQVVGRAQRARDMNPFGPEAADE